MSSQQLQLLIIELLFRPHASSQLLIIALLFIALQQFLIMASQRSSKCHDVLRSKCHDLIMRVFQPLIMREVQSAQAFALYRMPRQWALRTLRDAELVEMRLIDLQEMRDSSMQRVLMRWRLYANRLHNAWIQEYALPRESQWVAMKCSFLDWKTWAQAQQHSRCRARSTDIAVKCGDRLADALTTACFIRSQLSVFHPLSADQRFTPTESAEALQFNVPVVTSSLSAFPGRAAILN